ncbi:hypothetical protein [Kangiella shandongensis]|uniref:hypothetical protein n=1 Tax=Kangiella shandongensis TaxID=2763258 RepID=UPI001CBDDA13|nr:hypothetical protein [Kangiella shandongensis]
MYYLRHLVIVLAIALTACDDVRIVPAPSTSPDFEPIGDSTACHTCGQRALALCQEAAPDSYPVWFGFNAAGNCSAECSIGPTQFIGGISGTPRAACPYQVNTVINFNGQEVCPSGEPERGDRDFWGHGPRFSANITAIPNGGGTHVLGQISATWSETESDFSTITLPPTSIGTSHRLTQRPSFSAQNIRISRVSPSRSASVNRVMSSRQQEIISTASGDPLVKQLIVIGDTHAADISDDNNCHDDARIHSITFKPVRVTIEPTP